MTDDTMDALRFAVDPPPPPQVRRRWLKLTVLLCATFAFGLVSAVLLVVGVLAAAAAALPIAVVLAVGVWLTWGSRKLREAMARLNGTAVYARRPSPFQRVTVWSAGPQQN